MDASRWSLDRKVTKRLNAEAPYGSSSGTSREPKVTIVRRSREFYSTSSKTYTPNPADSTSYKSQGKLKTQQTQIRRSSVRRARTVTILVELTSSFTLFLLLFGLFAVVGFPFVRLRTFIRLSYLICLLFVFPCFAFTAGFLHRSFFWLFFIYST